MEPNIRYYDEVWSADDKKLGVAMSVHHRPDEPDPDLKYYDAYLEIQNFNLGMSYFIPTEFIGDRDQGSGRVMVEQTQKSVLNNTWYRRPSFVATGQGRREELPRV